MTTLRDSAQIEAYAAPDSLAEAARLAAGGAATVLAGGTDLMPQSQSGKLRLDGTLLNIRRIPELAGISRTGDTVRIGALTTVADILADPLVARHAPVLAETADCFASDQLRNMATVGGNICNASPAGDMIVPLLLLDAEIELASWSDGAVRSRTVALAAFFTGPGATVRRADEILTEMRFEVPGERFVAGFRKFGPRPALEVAMAAVGIAGNRSDDGALTGVRVAFGAVAPTPIRGRRTEEMLEGRVLDSDTIAAAARTAADEVAPISDVRASAWYRRHLVHVMTEELLSDAAGD